MNYLDSARLAAAFQMAGHEPAASEDEADIVFVNSCTVTARADQQTRQQSRQVERKEKQLALFGCGPKVKKEEWQKQFPGALVFADEGDILRHFGILEADLPELPAGTRTRLPIAIQTGCDNHCTFCITRIARGASRDFAAEAIVRQVKRAVYVGFQEVVLTGIQLAGWGCGDTEKSPHDTGLPRLIRQILAETALPRLRLSSLGPQFLTDEFFEVYKDERVCDHLHLSVQSGSPAVLRAMNRGHGVDEVYRAAEKAKKARPDTALTADLIVGFPGETASDFAETCQMAATIGFAKIHVFPFSPRAGTGAARFANQIAPAEKKRRALALREQGDRLRENFLSSQTGKQKAVLFEEKGTGLTTNYIRINGTGKRPGSIETVELTAANILAAV